MACARQRLRDRRGGGPAVRADRRRGSGRSAPPTRACPPTGSCCCPSPSSPGIVARLRIFNPDGSEAELSGNGAREAVLYLRRHGWTDADSFAIQTAAGEIRPRSPRTTECTVDMGRARLHERRLSRRAHADGRGELDRGRPHLALPARPGRQPAVRDPRRRRARARDARPPRDRTRDRAPRAVPEPHERVLVRRARFGPRPGRDRIRARIFERGVGETSASGTGATGAAVAYVLDGGELAGDGRARRRRARGRGRRASCDINLTGLGGAGVPRHARRDLRRGAACDASSRLDRIPPYLFAELERKVRAKRAAGVDVISLGIGDPDTPTYPRRSSPRRSARSPIRARTSIRSNRGRQEFREAVAAFYRAALRRRARPRDRGDAGDRRQGVHLQPEPGVPRRRATWRSPPTPAIPVYTGGPLLAGGEPVLMPLLAERGVRPRPRGDLASRPRARAADVPQLPQQPDRRDRARRAVRGGRRVRRATRDPRRPRQRLQRDDLTTATSPRRSCRPRAPRRSASRCSRCPRATT